MMKLHQTAYNFFLPALALFVPLVQSFVHTIVLHLLPPMSFPVISSTVKNFSQLLNLFPFLRNPSSTSPTSFKSFNWFHMCLFAPLTMFPLGKHSASSLPEASHISPSLAVHSASTWEYTRIYLPACQGIFPLVFLQIRSNRLGKKGEGDCQFCLKLL